MTALATLDRMSDEKKPTGGKHKAPRRPVQFPASWYAIARQLASRRPMPTVWYLVELVKKDAEANGLTDLPTPRWEDPDERTAKK